MPQVAKLGRPRGHDLRAMLLAAGVGQFNAQLSIPKMMIGVRSCDPYDQGVMQVVQALQNVMNAKGASPRLELTGFLDAPTQRELRRYSGSSWQDKSWAQVLGDVLDNQPAPRAAAAAIAPVPREPGLGDFVGDVLYSPLGLAAAGVAAWLFINKRKSAR